MFFPQKNLERTGVKFKRTGVRQWKKTGMRVIRNYKYSFFTKITELIFLKKHISIFSVNHN